MLLSQTDAAAVLGVSRRAITRRKESLMEMGVAVVEGKRTLYDSDRLKEAWLQLVQPQEANLDRLAAIEGELRGEVEMMARAKVAADAAGGVIPPFHESKARREHFAALKTEFEYQLTTGRYVLADDVAKDAQACAVAVRRAFEVIPDRICAQLAAETNPQEVYRMLAAEIRGVLLQMPAMIDAVDEEG